MNLKKSILLLLLFSFGLYVAAEAVPVSEIGNADTGSTIKQTDTPALAALKKRFNEGVMYRADLSHQFTDAYTGETTSSYGSIWFTRDSYKIDTPDQVIIVDDLVSTVFNKQQNRVIYSNYSPEEDDFAPSRYFSGEAGDYESAEIVNADGSTTITITTADAFEQFKEVIIRVSRNGTPVQIDAIDQMDNTIKTTFRFGRFESPTESIFAFQPPAGAEIVDMRE
jgi:outer membrane lipoprotein-sorting protein